MKYQIYYAKRISWRIDETFAFSEYTHSFIKEVNADNPEKVYTMMQGENWSPNGEARPLISKAGVYHTSMSMGDILVDENNIALVCAEYGFKKVINNYNES